MAGYDATATGLCATCTFRTSSGRIRWYQDGYSLLEHRNVTARLHRRRPGTTCVCQAKCLKRSETQFYSARVKGHLPQRSSSSGPEHKVFNQCFLSVSAIEKTHSSTFLPGMFFRQNSENFHTLLPFSYILFCLKTLKHAFRETVKFRPVYSWARRGKFRKVCFHVFLG